MPFTLAHPLYALPFVRASRKLPLSALVIGSMTPDLSIFLPYVGMHYKVNHSVRGILTIDLATGLAIFLVYHGILKFPLLTLLPPNAAQRLLPVANAMRLRENLSLWLWTLLALVLGSFDHLWVDSFTHGYGWPVHHWALLRVSMPLLHLPLYKGLQYTLSVVGMLGLAWAYRLWERGDPPMTTGEERENALHPLPSRKTVWWAVGATFTVALIFGLTFALGVRHVLAPPLKFRLIVADICVGGTPLLVLTLLTYAAVWRYRRREKLSGAPQQTRSNVRAD